MSFQPYLKGVPLLVLLWTGLTSGAAQIGPQSAAGDPLRQLERSVRSDHVSGQNHIPLWGGPDDDPTLAADYFPDRPPASAQKAASRAEHFSKKQKHDKAIEEYEKALRIDPSYYEADNNLALEFFTAGKPDLAIKTLRNLTEYNPKRVLAYDNLAIILLRLHRSGEAEAAASRAVEMHPFSYKANYVYGCALITQGKWTPDAKKSLKYASGHHAEAKDLLANWPHPAP